MIGIKLIKSFWVLAISTPQLKIDHDMYPESDITLARYKNRWGKPYFYYPIKLVLSLFHLHYISMWLGIKNVIMANHLVSLITSSTTDPWWSFLLVEETEIFWESHPVVASQQQNLTIVGSIKYKLARIRNYKFSGDSHRH